MTTRDDQLHRLYGTRQWVAAALIVMSVASPTLAAAYELRVGTRTKLTADIHAEGTRVTVDGHLRDNLGQGIEGVPIRVDFTLKRGAKGPVARDVRTDRTGRYYLTVTLAPGEHEVRITYSGKEHYYSPSALDSGVVSKRGAVLLSLQVPQMVVKGPEPLTVRVAASDGANPVPGLDVKVELGGALVEVVTGPEGTAAVPLELNGLEDPKVPIRASFEGSLTYAQASASAVVRVVDEPVMVVEATNVRARFDRGVRVDGEVSDRFGPVDGGVVDVELSQLGQLRGRYSTSAEKDGRFVVFVSEDRLEQGRLEVVAKLSLGAGSVAANTEIDVSKTGQGLLPWLLVTLLSISVLVLLGFAAKDGWQSFKRRRPRKRRRRSKLSDAREPVVTPMTMEEGDPPVTVGAESISGVLWDNQLDKPVLKGRVEVWDESKTRLLSGPVEVDSAGRFSISALPEGKQALHVSSKGYISARHSFKNPHGGRLSWFRFPLTPVRVVVRETYEDLVEDVLRESGSWGRLTPRQTRRLLLRALDVAAGPSFPGGREGYLAFKARLEEVLESSQEGSSLDAEAMVRAMVDVLEEIYYSKRLHDEALAVVMERLAQEARRLAEGGRR